MGIASQIHGTVLIAWKHLKCKIEKAQLKAVGEVNFLCG